MTADRKPEYPGDTIRMQQLIRGNELGDVRIQHYDKGFRVGTFLPGIVEESPGDTPKVFPEKSVWCSTGREAGRQFRIYINAAQLDGWSIQ